MSAYWRRSAGTSCRASEGIADTMGKAESLLPLLTAVLS